MKRHYCATGGGPIPDVVKPHSTVWEKRLKNDIQLARASVPQISSAVNRLVENFKLRGKLTGGKSEWQ